jgi:hypothetical protein
MESRRAPHRNVVIGDPREAFLVDLFDRLWDVYVARVSYVRTYEKVVEAAGATFVNDHIAFRTLATSHPAAGIFTLGRVFEALGYTAAGNYVFPDKSLSSVHFQHPNPALPKLFVSELRTWELSPETRGILTRCAESHGSGADVDLLTGLHGIGGASASVRESLLRRTVDLFTRLPWNLPEKTDVVAVNRETQFGAWVMVHGYAVNHFTAAIHSQSSPALDSIEKTIAALKAAGVPMKSEIEGAPGSKLRQSATEAVTIAVAVRESGRPVTMPWTYAYFELAERIPQPDPASGKPARFEGFLGPQATQLFEMTRVK